MKTISSGLATHYASGATTLATLWKLTRRDAEVFGFTDHDVMITFDGVDYEPSSVFDASAIDTKSELNVDNLEVTGLLDSTGIASDDIEAGLWDGAAVEVREVNWADLTMGANILRVGEVGQIQRKGGIFVAELRGLLAKLANNICRIYTDQCDADLGDARCGVNLGALTITGTVTAVASQQAFTASALAQAAGYFTYGKVTFTSGLNDGLAMEVKQHQTGGVFTLQLQMPYAIGVADTFTVTPGCNKLLKTAAGEYLGDCKVKFNNVVNFRAWPEVPGVGVVTRVGGQ